MKASEVTFLDLVQGEKQFQVPLYQRTYGWGRPQLDQLWSDLLDQAEASTASSQPPAHFVGSVVLAPSPLLQAGGVQRWLVVDGQQRLTTVMLALAALRDHVKPSDPLAADRIERQYLVNEFRDGGDKLRLLPTQSDRAAYRAIVTGDGGIVPPGSVADAHQWFRAAFAGLDDDQDHPASPAAVEQVIRSGLSIVLVTADAGDNVYRIFESLNNTGLRLRQADLLRNYLFMRLLRRGEDVYQDVWLPMQDQLSLDDLELLVWLDLVIRGDQQVKQGETYRVQQQRLEKIPTGDEAAVEEEVRALARRARHLQRIVDPSVESDPGVRDRLRSLRDWGAQTSYPLVMHLLDLRERGKATSGQVAEVLALIEGFLVRRMVCQVPTNNLNRLFIAAPAQVPAGEPVVEAVRRYLSGERRYWPTDARVRESARTRPFYWTGRGPQRTFVLRRLEESHGASEPVDFERAKFSIEHVLPQTPTPEWLDLLASDVEEGQSPQELHSSLVHTIGNLTLTAENSTLSNHPLERKQGIYDRSALRMNREIAEAPAWGRQQILDRSDELADRIVDLWPGPSGDQHDTGEGRDWSLLHRACAALPPGAWTTYGDLAELIGSHPVPVGSHLSQHPVANAWRVLTADGTVSPQFRWLEPDRQDDPREILQAEGVSFDGRRADPEQRWDAQRLAVVVGMDTAGD